MLIFTPETMDSLLHPNLIFIPSYIHVVISFHYSLFLLLQLQIRTFQAFIGYSRETLRTDVRHETLRSVSPSTSNFSPDTRLATQHKFDRSMPPSIPPANHHLS